MKKIISKLLSAVVIGLFTACGNNENQQESQADTVARPLEVSQVVGIGKVEPQSGLIDLAIDQAGVIAKVHKKEGDSVRRGEVILEIDAEEMRLQTENLEIQLRRQQELTAQAMSNEKQLEAEVRKAQTELQASRELAGYGAETVQNVQALETELEVLKAQLQGAKNATQSNRLAGREIANQIEQSTVNSSGYSLRAGRDGVLVSLNAEQGDAVEAFAVLGQLAADEDRIVHGEADELFAHKLKEGQRVRIVKEGSDQKIADGEIVYLSPILHDKSIFYDKPGEVSDRRVRRFKVGFSQQAKVLINTKVECIIQL